MKSVVLLSGGLDSALVLAMAKKVSLKIVAINFLYGQYHKIETVFADKIAKKYEVPLISVTLPLGELFVSPLSESSTPLDGPVPVPGRNTVFLSMAMAYAQAHDYDSIWIGANKEDYRDYPDCRKDYFESFEKVSYYSCSREIKVITPLIEYKKEDIVSASLYLEVPINNTHSCYFPRGKNKDIPCKECYSCVSRKKAFLSLGVIDESLKSF